MINYRDIAKETVADAFFDALTLCEAWCRDEDYTYDFDHIIQVAKLILEAEDRIGTANET